jgi:hypothetical protein
VSGGLGSEKLLGLPIRLRGIELGRPVDLLLDLAARRVVGFDVVCGDDRHRFLALAATSLWPDEIEVASALPLLAQLPFYKKQTASLAELRGRSVARGNEEVGRLREVVVGADGEIEALVVEREGELRREPVDGLVVRANGSPPV